MYRMHLINSIQVTVPNILYFVLVCAHKPLLLSFSRARHKTTTDMLHYIDKPFDKKVKKDLNDSSDKVRPKMGFFRSKFMEFCKRTDLHGYKYIVMKDLNLFERSLWATAVLASTVCAAYFVYTAYNWYARNPIVTVIESTQGPIWDIPFPAVTICNLNVISRKAARQFADTVTLPANVTADDVFEALRLAPLLHSTYLPYPEYKEYLLQLQDVLELNSVSIETMFTRLSPAATCEQLVKRCIWKNTIYRCDTLFQQVFTFFSVCCSFNYFAMYNANKVTSLDGRDSLDMPRRVASCGYQTALTVLLDTQPDDYYSSSVASQGALVFIDNAYNIADIDSPVRIVNPSSEVLIALSPERTYTTAGIRAFSPHDRQCYFSDEVQIGNFRQYSYHNCIAYQRVDTIKTACDCVPYYFQLKETHRTCNFNDLDCLQGFVGNYMNRTRSGKAHDGRFQCLPECEHYDYPLEVALGKLATNVRLDELPFFNDVRLENHSLVNVFFNDLVSTRYRRDVYLNWQNLLASFGGLLSLMLGFTLISGFDLILFFTFGLVYRLITEHSDEDHKPSGNKLKDNRINVQEYKPEQPVRKKHSGKGYGKWHAEIPYDVNNFTKTKRY